ncbi:hypothetical protein RHSIM_Rhsim07G0088000 [Rhododendron simsii]|uniref:Nuclear transport factor 2 domain-containing protein n=1 Tax=Rhododendron simsii TaxID=118357 RepID=A0A834GPV3_RHOSS|nr:hypothetical protein RHSIM_Rhsim07G0088000 [Rhododendron simsii]
MRNKVNDAEAAAAALNKTERGRRPLPKRGQIKSRIASKAYRAIVLWFSPASSPPKKVIFKECKDVQEIMISFINVLNPLATASQLAPMAFSGQATGWSTFSNTKIWDHSFLPKKKCRFKSNNMKTPRRQMCMRLRAEVGKQTCTRAGSWKRRYTDSRLKVLSSSDIIPNPPSPFETIKQFYACINKKDLNQLGEFISDDCFLDDCSFYRPFQGKTEVMEFFGQLLASMGPNIEFKIRLVSGGNDFTTGVIWHLEWNKKKIPLTKGSSFYECSTKGTKLLIRRAQVMTESPMKPGRSALALLKFLASLFDAFPKATEWFLDNFHLILQEILKVYKIVLGPFINPVLGWYIKLWKFKKHLLISTLNIFILISKIFN